MTAPPIRFALLLLPLLCAMHSPAAEKTVFDFQSATNADAWQIVNDDVMGGLSTSRFCVTNGLAVFSGDLSLANNGGFASVRSLPAQHDLGGCDTFGIRIRGDGHRYKFTARINSSFDGPIYQAAFPTSKGQWEEHRLPSKDFVPTYRGRVLSGQPPLRAADVKSVGFLISDKQDGPFRLEIAWVKATASSRL